MDWKFEVFDVSPFIGAVNLDGIEMVSFCVLNWSVACQDVTWMYALTWVNINFYEINSGIVI